MLLNLIKQLFYCGIFHKTKLCMDTGYPEIEPSMNDIGQIAVCSVCGTTYEVWCDGK